jgi:dGTPase
MLWTEAQRATRRHSVAQDDQRKAFERDRDRILYSSAFRRLSGITQVVRAGEADVFHTRQQHTLKVAQLGRRLAQLCKDQNDELAEHLGLHEEALEAACLAHDLGHPPFGHVGEHVLHELVIKAGDDDGFEGNAQSFRVLTKLAVRYEECDGLDLTRATLASTLKYPWLRDPSEASRAKKWGAYKLDKEDFDFARKYFQNSAKTAEAELMDWADDIAYSVHDLEDFHRCGALPWHRILDDQHAEDLIESADRAWFGKPNESKGRLRTAMRSLKKLLNIYEEVVAVPYEGTRDQRQQLRTMTSTLIGRYVNETKLKEPDDAGVCIDVAHEYTDEVKLLKQITRDYVINNPTLAAQQRGQERVLRKLFETLYDDSKAQPPRYLPPRLAYLWDLRGDSTARFVADCIGSLTEAEAVGLHNRLQGTFSGSVLDPIVR